MHPGIRAARGHHQTGEQSGPEVVIYRLAAVRLGILKLRHSTRPLYCMTQVQLQNIEKSFAGHSVLRGLCLKANEGEYVVLLGPSGCGKTTTLRLISGLQTPDRGKVMLGGRCVNRTAPRHRDVSMVFQQDGLYPHLTVAQSLQMALGRDLSRDECSNRIGQSIELTGISEILDCYPGQLSGGQLRRASVAKAIARRASVRLLDEPLSALDVPARYALQNDLVRWHLEAQGTTIHVTHDGHEAMRMADKIAVMDQGRIVQCGVPSEIYDRPATMLVAQSIGSPPINLLKASQKNGQFRFHGASSAGASPCTGPNPISASLFSGLSDLSEVIVGIRPDAFRRAPQAEPPSMPQPPMPQPPEEPPTEATGVIELWVNVLRCQRVDQQLHLVAEFGEQTIVATLACARFGLGATMTGPCRLSVCANDVHLFDAATGQRLTQGIHTATSNP